MSERNWLSNLDTAIPADSKVKALQSLLEKLSDGVELKSVAGDQLCSATACASETSPVGPSENVGPSEYADDETAELAIDNLERHSLFGPKAAHRS